MTFGGRGLRCTKVLAVGGQGPCMWSSLAVSGLCDCMRTKDLRASGFSLEVDSTI